MGKELKFGKKVMCIWVYTLTTTPAVTEYTYDHQVKNIKGNGKVVSNMVLGYETGLKTTITKANEKRVNHQATGSMCGQTETDMRASFKINLNMEWAKKIFQTVIDMLEST